MRNARTNTTTEEISTDVLIAGGGVSGLIAAIASIRAGGKTILVEAGSAVGGIMVEGPLEALMTFHDKNGPVIAGISEEFIERMIARGGSPGYVGDTVGYCETIVPYDSEIAKLTALEMLYDDNVTVMLNSLVTDVRTDEEKITSVVVENKSGRTSIQAGAFVDATGDGNLAMRAGADFMIGRSEDSHVQPMTTLIKIADVDTKLLRDYIRRNPDQFVFGETADINDRYLHLWGFTNILNDGYSAGALSLKRNEVHAMLTPREGEIIINYTRYSGDPTDNHDVTYAQYKTLKQAHELMDYLRITLPAFKNAYIVHTGKIGVRESRRICGEYVLELNDIINSVRFDDAVAQGAFPVDIHQPDGDSMVYKKVAQAYQIPARCLTSKNFFNLFMCGRCISAGHEVIASARITATSMATGQAAGVMAAMQAENGRIDIKSLRNELIKQNCLI